MVVAQKPRLWRREEYEQMVEAGILGPEDRVELVAGEILTMSPQNSPHATAVRLVENALRFAFPAGHDVRAQLPLALSEDSEPEPDVMVVAGSPRDYRDAHPSTALLVVEIGDSTLSLDRGLKKSIYARAGIPEYWILNLLSGVLEVYREPRDGEYASASTLGPRDTICPLSSPAVTVLVADLLP